MTAIAAEPLFSTICADADMIEVVEEFLDELPKRLAQMQAAVDSADPTTLARLAHQLKGAGGSYGFPCLTDVAAQLEQLARGKLENASVDATLDELARLCQRLQAVPSA